MWKKETCLSGFWFSVYEAKSERLEYLENHIYFSS